MTTDANGAFVAKKAVDLGAHPTIESTVWKKDGGVLVHLDERERGVAAGQSVVLYDGTRVIGSATITATRRATASTSSA